MTSYPVIAKNKDMYDCIGWVKVRHSLFGPRKVWYMRLMGSTLSLHESSEKAIALEYSVISCKVVSHILTWCFTVKLSNGQKLRVSCDSKKEAKQWKEALRRASNQVFSEEFALLEAIEETNGCTIFNAVDIYDQSKVRVQRIDRDPFDALNFEKTQALCRQLYAVRNLGHHNLLWAISVFHEADYAYIVTKRVKGKRLSNVLAEHGGALSESMTRYLVKQLVEAISYMHLKGFVLRKVTLDNIWCDYSDSSDPRIILADFADVSFVDDEEDLRIRHKVGDTRYHAPEVATEVSYNAAVDLFALGVCVYRMLSGSFPLESNVQRLSQMIEQREQELAFGERVWSSISAEAKAFVRSLLQPSWLNRMTADEAEEDQWFEISISESEKSIEPNAESFMPEEIKEAVDESDPERVESISRVQDIQALLQENQAVLSPLMIRLLSPLSEEAPLSVKSAVDTFASTLKERNIVVEKPSLPAV
ncbi:Protein kinase-like domain [Gracilaria domingensis]|nr:Protein kinase-like domain [Gracilaria domingensis]